MQTYSARGSPCRIRLANWTNGCSAATTIHKSQGSEYPVVVIPISTQHYMMLKRNLIYTGITRGKRLVVLVGQKKALAMAVKGKQVERRWSKLKERLSATGKS